VARVISHVSTGDRVVIEADVPRRYIERLTAPAVVEEAGHGE
jgi:riboflavin synthase alpha subunit